ATVGSATVGSATVGSATVDTATVDTPAVDETTVDETTVDETTIDESPILNAIRLKAIVSSSAFLLRCGTASHSKHGQRQNENTLTQRHGFPPMSWEDKQLRAVSSSFGNAFPASLQYEDG
ncbi:MAG TPA: hypothetical protein PKE31_19805, partial [Pseudomonadota bacterium]|nr:hypothetical protein [Pseudomonadota bacterium]